MITFVTLVLVAIFGLTLGRLIQIEHRRNVALDELKLKLLDDHWTDMGRYLASRPAWAVPEKSVGINTEFGRK